MAWISVKDELPPNSEEVLLWDWLALVRTGYSISGRWYDATTRELMVGITHWQKLPEPPEEWKAL